MLSLLYRNNKKQCNVIIIIKQKLLENSVMLSLLNSNYNKQCNVIIIRQ